MTKILFDCPTCGCLKTIRVDGPACLVKFNCFVCHKEYRLDMKLSRVNCHPGPKPKKQTPKMVPLKKVVFDNKDPKKETQSDEAVDNGRKTD